MTTEERDNLFSKNKWTVDAVVNKYANSQNYQHAIDKDEMHSWSTMYALYGTGLYKSEKGASPSSYIYWWAKAGALKYLYQNRVVHLPNNKINDSIKSRRNFNQDGDDFVAIHKEVSFDQFESFENGSGVSFWDRSLGKYGSNIQQGVQESLTAQKKSMIGFHSIEETELKDHLEYVIQNAGLSSVEKFTIVHRMGMLGEERKTQEEVSNLTHTDPSILGRTYTTMGICKAEHRALNKLKDNELLQDVLT